MILHAIVVGIDRYRDARIRDLRCARADAEAVAAMVEKIRPQERRIQLILNEEATKERLLVAIGEDLPRAVEHPDVVLLYFAGHGSPETSGGPDEVTRYLIAHDTAYEHVYATGIDMERELPRWIQRIPQASMILVVVDACFSGGAGGRTFEGPRLRAERAGSRGPLPISLADLDLGEGRLMLTACDDDQVAREDTSLGHGVFTYYFLRGPAGPDEGSVGVSTFYDELSAAVHLHTQGRQTPVLNGRAVSSRLPYLW